MSILPPFIDKIIGSLNVNLNLSGWFTGWTFKDSFKFTKTKVDVGKIQIAQVVVVGPDGVPKLTDGGGESLAQLKQSLALLPGAVSESVQESGEEKGKINRRIDDAVALMKLYRFDEALTSLLTTLGEIKNKEEYLKEQVRIFNNLGVIYNRPRPEGDYDKAIEYLKAALDRDPLFAKARMNLASAYINKETPEALQQGYDLIKILWESEKDGDVLQTLLWSIYKLHGARRALEFLESDDEAAAFLETKEYLLNVVALLHLELDDPEEAIKNAEKAVTLSPEEPELISMKARALMIRAQKTDEIPSEFDIVPKFKDYADVRSALELFTRAEQLAETQKKHYMLPELRYGISTCLTWLGKFDESRHKIKQIRSTPDLPEVLAHQVNILDFASLLNNREFETAYHLLTNAETYSKISYVEKRRISRVFLTRGAPEQAKLLLDELAVEAEKAKDVSYWLDLSVAATLLGNQQDAISAASRAKKMSSTSDSETRKRVLSHYNAVNYHYSKSDSGENSETDRMVEGMMEFQKEFPEEKILTPIKAIDENGELTSEIKDVLNAHKDRYESIREAFKTEPIPIYLLEEIFGRSFANEMAYRGDPEFTIEYTGVDEATKAELKENFEASSGFVFDYLSLLDLAKMDFLGFLEGLDKPIYVHEKLFDVVQEELLQNEIEELRRLWNFLRRSRAVVLVRESTQTELKGGKLEDIYSEWMIESMRFAKANNLTLVTNDLRTYRYLKFEEIRPLNTAPLLSHWVEEGTIDERMHARALGDLAERFYIFLSFRGEDLYEIVLEDKGKITPRSYHLVREIFLPGSNMASFTQVYAKFIELFWRSGSLSDQKVAWLKFLTGIITKIIDDRLATIAEGKATTADAAAIHADIKPIALHLAVMWRTAIKNGSKDDLIELSKVVDEVLDKVYLTQSKEKLKTDIAERLKQLSPKT